MSGLLCPFSKSLNLESPVQKRINIRHEINNDMYKYKAYQHCISTALQSSNNCKRAKLRTLTAPAAASHSPLTAKNWQILSVMLAGVGRTTGTEISPHWDTQLSTTHFLHTVIIIDENFKKLCINTFFGCGTAHHIAFIIIRELCCLSL